MPCLAAGGQAGERAAGRAGERVSGVLTVCKQLVERGVNTLKHFQKTVVFTQVYEQCVNVNT